MAVSRWPVVDGLLPRSLSQLASLSLFGIRFVKLLIISSLGRADIFLEGGGPNIIVYFFGGSGEAWPLLLSCSRHFLRFFFFLRSTSLPLLSLTKCSVKRLFYPLSFKNWSSNAKFP